MREQRKQLNENKPKAQFEFRDSNFLKKLRGEYKMARKKIIAGNWKMNMTPSEAVK